MFPGSGDGGRNLSRRCLSTWHLNKKCSVVSDGALHNTQFGGIDGFIRLRCAFKAAWPVLSLKIFTWSFLSRRLMLSLGFGFDM